MSNSVQEFALRHLQLQLENQKHDKIFKQLENFLQHSNKKMIKELYHDCFIKFTLLKHQYNLEPELKQQAEQEKKEILDFIMSYMD